MKQSFFIFLFTFSLSCMYRTAWTHPHVFVDFSTIPHIENNRLKALDIQWTFDRFTSEMFVEDIDKNKNGRIDESEMPYFDENYRSVETEAHFFLTLYIGDERCDAHEASLREISIQDSLLVYEIEVTFPDEWTATLEDGIYGIFEDPEMFVAFSYQESQTTKRIQPDPKIHVQSQSGRSNTFSVRFQDRSNRKSDTSGDAHHAISTIHRSNSNSHFGVPSFLKWFRTSLFTIQSKYNRKLGEIVMYTKDRFSLKSATLLMLMAFVYGLLHALGPGHGKSIVVGYFLQRKSSAIRVLSTALRISILHTGSAVLLAFFLQTFLTSYSGIQRLRVQSYISFAVALIILLIGSILFVQLFLSKRKNRTITQKKASAAFKERWIYIAGFIPCPLSITIMFVAVTQNVPVIGLLTILSISLGMFVVLTAAGLTAMSSKNIAHRFSSRRWGLASHLHDGVELVGAFVIVLFGISLSLLYFPNNLLS